MRPWQVQLKQRCEELHRAQPRVYRLMAVPLPEEEARTWVRRALRFAHEATGAPFKQKDREWIEAEVDAVMADVTTQGRRWPAAGSPSSPRPAA